MSESKFCQVCNCYLTPGPDRKPVQGVIACSYCWEEYNGNAAAIRENINMTKPKKTAKTTKKESKPGSIAGCDNCGKMTSRLHAIKGDEGYVYYCTECYHQYLEDADMEEEQESAGGRRPKVR